MLVHNEALGLGCPVANLIRCHLVREYTQVAARSGILGLKTVLGPQWTTGDHELAKEDSLKIKNSRKKYKTGW